LISGFWIISIPQIFGKKQELGVVYLLLFLGVVFSIIVLLTWRFITHLISDEEVGYRDNIFINQKFLPELLKDEKFSELDDQQIMKKKDEIREKYFAIYLIKECLSNEFDNSFNFSDTQLKKLIEKKPTLYPKRFEKGKLRFDWLIFYLIYSFFISGLYLFYLTLTIQVSNNNFFNFYKSLILLIPIISLLLFYFIIKYAKDYLFQNFIVSNSRGRRRYIESIINDNIDKQNKVCNIEYFLKDYKKE